MIVNDSTRRTIRTGVQLGIDILLVIPLAVTAADLHATAVGGALVAVGAAVTKVMNLAIVERFLQRHVPWLAAQDLLTDTKEPGT